MAYDKLVDSSALDYALTATANAIRTKTGDTASLEWDASKGFADAIAEIEAGTEIPDGYILPSGSVTITENGTHDVTEKTSVVVEVPIPDGYIVPSGSETITANGEYDITEKASVVVAVPEPEITLQNKVITENGTYTADTGYDGLGQVTVNVASSGGSASDAIDSMLAGTMTEINSDVTTVTNYACYGMSKLATVILPNATHIGSLAFANCTSLAVIYAPNVVSSSLQVFDACKSLTEVNFPLLTGLYGWYFRGCTGLIKADFAAVKSIPTSAFQNTTSLKALILRKADAIATLSNANAFAGSTVASGTGYIYVPRALVDTYKAASNWSTYASQFRALEDYTVDGTITGALDESKI